MSEQKVLEFEVPCCYSGRTCVETYHAVISLKTGQVLRVIHAVRCKSLGYVPKYKFYQSDDVILVSYYATTRGNTRLKILWKPEGVPEDLAKAVALQALVPDGEE